MTRLRRAIFLSLLIWSAVACLAGPLQAAEPSVSPTRRQSEVTYQDTTLTEDVSWRGSILVKGYLAIAPQATLRIEPGTVVRFQAANGSRQLPRLVVMGRIHAMGTHDRPIQFLPRQGKPARGSWGGIQLLSTEKRNQLDHCRIEGAETGIDARFSSFATKAVTITTSTNGMVLHDSTVSIMAGAINNCETGLEVADSELELKDAVIAENRIGLKLVRSSVVMSSLSVKGNVQQGLQSEDCRLKVGSCEFEGNGVGAQIKGGEGQLFLSRFLRNRETGLHLSVARFKVNRCRISDNGGDGLLLDDSRSVVWGSDISGNAGYNLVYSGRENAAAVRNWWGTVNESLLLAKINNSGAQRSGLLNIYPWLTEKPNPLP